MTHPTVVHQSFEFVPVRIGFGKGFADKKNGHLRRARELRDGNGVFDARDGADADEIIAIAAAFSGFEKTWRQAERHDMIFFMRDVIHEFQHAPFGFQADDIGITQSE